MKMLPINSDNRYKHGLCHTPEYIVWRGMVQRCYDVNYVRYPDYGGRGIDICPTWRHDFGRFYSDMGPRPSSKHQIDRLDNDKGYSLNNCEWKHQIENALNKRVYTNNQSGYKGVSFDKRAKAKPWRATVMRNKKQTQIGAFETPHEAHEARQLYLNSIN